MSKVPRRSSVDITATPPDGAVVVKSSPMASFPGIIFVCAGASAFDSVGPAIVCGAGSMILSGPDPTRVSFDSKAVGTSLASTDLLLSRDLIAGAGPVDIVRAVVVVVGALALPGKRSFLILGGFGNIPARPRERRTELLILSFSARDLRFNAASTVGAGGSFL